MGREKKDIGDYGEQIAQRLLEQMGMSVICRNFTCKGGEIDIIAVSGTDIRFVEVKTRRVGSQETIEASLGDAKLRSLHKAAVVYLSKNRFSYDYEVFFDLVTVIIEEGEMEHRTEYTPSFFFPSW